MMAWPEFPPDAAKYFTSTEACSCPQWRFRPWARPCKHQKALRQAIELVDANRRKWATRPLTV